MASEQANASSQFYSLAQQRAAARVGMWAFLVTEIMFFGGLFCCYTIYRHAYPVAFAAGSERLNVALGTANTAVLIGSSLTMALAVRSAQLGRIRAQNLFLFTTMIAGSVFLGIKAFEYYTDYTERLVPGRSFEFSAEFLPAVELFYSLYFAMTGVHALHMIIGLSVILALALRAAVGRLPRDNYAAIEVTGLYWHFVDIIWIFLFPLLYLI